MFSLGMILFEMCCPLKTAMERAQTLEALRKEGYVLPHMFEEPDRILQGEIIKSLVRHRVSERPSSQELLRSGKIPIQDEDETFRTALQLLSSKSSAFYARLMKELFRQPNDESNAKDYTYDLGFKSSLDPEDSLLQTFVQEKLVEVFRRHGAVEIKRPQLLPSSDYYNEQAVRFLNSSGKLVQLPYDLTLPFARVIARQSDKEIALKSYYFGPVFREAAANVHPVMVGEVDFDIISNDSLDLALREAEVIKVVDEIIDSVPSFAASSVVYHISHSRLLDAILVFCGVAPEKFSGVKQIVSKLNIGQWTWAKIRNELRSAPTAISSTSLDDLMRFNFRGRYEEAITKLRDLLQDTDELESTFRHLEAVTTYLERFRVGRKVYINPLSSVNEKFYQGHMLFQCVSEGKHKSVLCAGGRYDRLIRDHRTAKQGEKHAVGFNLSWENFVHSMKQYHKASGKNFLKKGEELPSTPWLTRRCDVLIDSTDTAILRSIGIKIAQELWANDISAELVIDSGIKEATSHHQQQSNKDGSNSHDWLVLIKQDGTLKIRSAISKEDVEKSASELVGWLRLEMRERDRTEGRFERGRTHNQYTHTAEANNERAGEVSVLTSQAKSKKGNRRNIIEDGKQLSALYFEHYLIL